MGAYVWVDRGDLLTYLVTMGLMILVGLIGAGLHVVHDLTGQGVFLVERAIRGAPLMAPLLFANMGALGVLILLHPKPEQEDA